MDVKDIIKHNLKNLSVGTYGVLEREKWMLETKLKVLNREYNQLVNEKVESLKKEIANDIFSINQITNILQSEYFKTWYKNQFTNNEIPDVNSFSNILKRGIVREYLLQLTDKDLFEKLIDPRI